MPEHSETGSRVRWSCSGLFPSSHSGFAQSLCWQIMTYEHSFFKGWITMASSPNTGPEPQTPVTSETSTWKGLSCPGHHWWFPTLSSRCKSSTALAAPPGTWGALPSSPRALLSLALQGCSEVGTSVSQSLRKGPLRCFSPVLCSVYSCSKTGHSQLQNER